MLKEGDFLPCADTCPFNRNCYVQVTGQRNENCRKNIQEAVGPPTIFVDRNNKGTISVFEHGSGVTPRIILDNGRVVKILKA